MCLPFRFLPQSFVSTSDRWRAHTAPPTAPELPPHHQMSTSSKKPVKGDPTALGPGKYNIPDPWIRQVGGLVQDGASLHQGNQKVHYHTCLLHSSTSIDSIDFPEHSIPACTLLSYGLVLVLITNGCAWRYVCSPWGHAQGKASLCYRRPAFGSDVKQHQLPVRGNVGGGVMTPGPGELAGRELLGYKHCSTPGPGVSAEGENCWGLGIFQPLVQV